MPLGKPALIALREDQYVCTKTLRSRLEIIFLVPDSIPYIPYQCEEKKDAERSRSKMNTSVMNNIVWFVLLLVFFYFILIRPQQKAMKAHQKLVSELEVGSKVITKGGIYGTITAVDDDNVMLQIDKNVVLQVDRTSIERLQAPKS
jgi:preprotein translocase subunit YajC